MVAPAVTVADRRVTVHVEHIGDTLWPLRGTQGADEIAVRANAGWYAIRHLARGQSLCSRKVVRLPDADSPMAKAFAIKILAAIGMLAALGFGVAPTSWLVAALIALAAFLLMAWGVFDVNSPLWAPTLWRIPGVNAVALTFDDGPDPEFTTRVLEILARKKVTATFFVVGERARANQDLLREIDRQGHLIGNHSFSHASTINFAFHARLTREISRCNEVIEAAIGKRPQFYRSPHGFKNPAVGDVLTKLGMNCVGWQVRGFDAVRSNASAIANRLVRKAKPGGILLLHDGSGFHGTHDRSATLEALPMIIDGLRARGFAFKRLDEPTAPPAKA